MSKKKNRAIIFHCDTWTCGQRYTNYIVALLKNISMEDIETIEDSVYSYIDANYLDEGMNFSEFTILVEDVLAESGYDYEFLDTCEINI